MLILYDFVFVTGASQDPKTLTVEAVGDKSGGVTLTIQPADVGPYIYTIKSVTTAHTLSDTTSSSSFHVTGLHPNYEYNIKVTTDKGYSGEKKFTAWASGNFHFVSSNSYYYGLIKYSVCIFLAGAEPKTPKADATAPKQITVSWEIPKQEYDTIENFKITLTPTAGGDPRIETAVNTATSLVVDNLVAFTEYDVNIYTVNNQNSEHQGGGEGAPAKVPKVKTWPERTHSYLIRIAFLTFYKVFLLFKLQRENLFRMLY